MIEWMDVPAKEGPFELRMNRNRNETELLYIKDKGYEVFNMNIYQATFVDRFNLRFKVTVRTFRSHSFSAKTSKQR